VRPCPTCDCFVPVAARRCPRCAAALEPVCEEVGTERDLARDPVLVGVGSRAAAHTNGSGQEAFAGLTARLSLPPLDSPALRPRRPQLPKLPQPFATDPLVLAVFLGIPPVTPEPQPKHTNGHATEPLTGSGNTFGALLGTSVDAPETVRAIDDLLPESRTGSATPTPTAPPSRQPLPAPVLTTPVATPVAVPLAVSDIAVAAAAAGVPPRRARFSKRDPFARNTTRRERVLARLCWTLAIALALAVIMLRLPLGSRPALSPNAAIAPASSSVTSTPFTNAVREQTHADLLAVITTAQRLDLASRSYVPATPAVLNHYLAQFGFVASTQASTRMGELSVARSKHELVVAEYAGPGQCAFARVVDQQPATSVGPVTSSCSAASTPKLGWAPLIP
jgi:hypothetical protein